MEDRSESRLEEELHRLRPAGLPEALLARMRDAADERLTLGDQVLACCTGIGAIAAMLIVSVVVWHAAVTPVAPAMSPQEIAAHHEMAAEYRAMVASL